MFDVFRENLPKTLLIFLSPVLLAVLYLTLALRLTIIHNDGYVGALLDDTWIHVRFAYHISQGNGLSYNEGVVTPGATSPLWVLMLGGIYAFVRPEINQQMHIAIGLSAVGHVAAVMAITGFGWWGTRRAWIGLLAGTITALTGRFLWMGLSGMEITTFTALCIVALWSHMHDVRVGRVFGWRTGILTALATLARPEGYLLAVLIGLDAFILVPQANLNGDFWIRVRAGWRGVVAYVLLAGTYPLVCLLLTGYPLPNTFRAKSQLGRDWPDLRHAFFWEPNVDHGLLLILLAVVGTGFLLWRAHRDRTGYAWGLWPVLFVLGVLLLGPQNFVVNNSRYVAPAIPFHALAGAIGVWATSLVLSRRITPVNNVSATVARSIPVILNPLLIVTTIVMGADQAPRVANDVAQLRRMHVTAAHWFAEYTLPGERIALNDVGAIAHISNRSVLDLVGLVSPEVIEAIQDEPRFTCPHDLQVMRVMRDNPPVLIGIFPWFFPCLTGQWADALQPFNVFTITGTTVIAGGELVVYWPIWENWPVQRAVASGAIPLEVDFEQGISLVGYETQSAVDGLRVTLWWQVSAQPEETFTVFAHLIDETGEIIAQKDSMPQDGRFNTRWWLPGDIIRDVRLIELPETISLEEKQFALRIGLYPTLGGTRLPRIAAPIDELDFVVVPLENE